jgi:hypothetical protein
MPVQAQRRDGGTAPTHSQTGNRRRVVSTILRLLYPRQRPDIQCTGKWVCLGAALERTKNLPPGIRYSDRPARSESLSYPDRPIFSVIYGINILLWKVGSKRLRWAEHVAQAKKQSTDYEVISLEGTLAIQAVEYV